MCIRDRNTPCFLKSTMNGHCQCKAITFQTPLPSPTKVHFCHCLECRHQSSSAFGITAFFPPFELPQSEHLGCWDKYYPDGSVFHHYFCKVCGSRLLHTNGEIACVKGGCLEGLSKDMLKGAAHIWTKSCLLYTSPSPRDATLSRMPSSA